MDHRARLVSMGNRNEILSDTYGSEARTSKAVVYEEDNHPSSNIKGRLYKTQRCSEEIRKIHLR